MSDKHIGNILILLAAFAITFGASIGKYTCNLSNEPINNVINYNSLFLLLFIPIFLIHSHKCNDIMGKIIYALAIIPFIFWSDILSIMQIKLPYYLCVFVQAALVGLCLRFVANNIKQNSS